MCMIKIFLLLHLSLPPLPPSKVVAEDVPNDAGGKIEIEWELSPDDSIIDFYIVFKQKKIEGEWSKPETLTVTKSGVNQAIDTECRDGIEYRYFVRAVKENEWSDSPFSNIAISSAQWFHKKRTSVLILLIIIVGFLLYFIQKTRKGEASVIDTKYRTIKVNFYVICEILLFIIQII